MWSRVDRAELIALSDMATTFSSWRSRAVGIYPGYSKWQDFLHEVGQEPVVEATP
jgi:hypothetical protein